MSGRTLLRSVASRASRASFAARSMPRLSILGRQPAHSISAICVARSPLRSSLAQFSTSAMRCESEGQVNAELSAKLESELAMEKEMRDTASLPEHLQEYLDNSPFALADTPGKEDVILTRKFGDETIRVSFSVDDLNNVDEDADQLQEQALEDELEDGDDMAGKGNINQTSNPRNAQIATEDRVAPADREEDEDGAGGEQEPSFPAHVTVTVERPGKGALEIQTIAQDGVIVIDDVHYFKDAKFLDPKTSEDNDTAASIYTGPPFNNLDEDLQILFEKYLDERGINTTMALFIPEYIDFKEQNEYLSWLSGIKKFVD